MDNATPGATESVSRMALEGSARGLPIYGRKGIIRAFAMLDPEDYERCAPMRWALVGKGYVAHTPPSKGTIYLHRFLTGLVPGDGLQVDHLNGDRLDNRRANLLVVTPSENRQNQHTVQGETSRHRGVSRCPGGWKATVRVGGRSILEKTYATEDEAVRATVAARRLHMPNSAEARAVAA